VRSDENRLTQPVGPRDHTAGPDTAPVTLLEYGDFECPQCGRAYPIVKQLQTLFGAQLRFVFRHFPLTNSHPHAQRAAEAAEWAAAHGAFWPMHDALFTHQKALGDDPILALAPPLGLDPASLRGAWAQHSFIPRVKEDFLSGIASGVVGTPAFFINGVRHREPWDLETLGRALQSQVDSQRSG
jgi:protein-disulfide isomerase